MFSDILSGLDGEDFVWQSYEIIAGATVADADEVDVAIYQTGEEGRIAVVDFGCRGTFWRLHGFFGADLPDFVAFRAGLRLAQRPGRRCRRLV